MNFKFHHMNLCTDNLPRLTNFYQTLFDLGTINDAEHTVVSGQRREPCLHRQGGLPERRRHRVPLGRTRPRHGLQDEAVRQPDGAWPLLLPHGRHQGLHAQVRRDGHPLLGLRDAGPSLAGTRSSCRTPMATSSKSISPTSSTEQVRSALAVISKSDAVRVVETAEHVSYALVEQLPQSSISTSASAEWTPKRVFGDRIKQRPSRQSIQRHERRQA